MQLHNVQPRTPNTPTMIVGRGGKRGKTSGRGGKGQTARAGNKRRPELRDFIKRLPKLRGRGVNQNKSFAIKPFAMNLDVIEKTFTKAGEITPAILLEKGLVSLQSGKLPAIKILGEGEVTKAFTISGCIISDSAKVKIEKAGGKVTVKEVKEAPVSEKANKAMKKAAAKAAAPAKPAPKAPAKKAPKTDKPKA